MSISYEEASSKLNYDPETGNITWKTHNKPDKIGTNALTGKVSGYLTASVKYRSTDTGELKTRGLLAHRIAWLLSFKKHPDDRTRIRHIDGNRANNRLSNLAATSFEEARADSFGLTLTYSRAHEVFDYEPLTGNLRWKVQLNARAPKGSIAGTPHNHGYRQLKVDGLVYLAHRVVWLMTTGEFPEEGMCIDHINGVRDDNRISNLRVVSYMENSHNTKAKGTYRAGNKYGSQISVNYKELRLGLFDTEEEARQAYLDAKEQHFPGLIRA